MKNVKKSVLLDVRHNTEEKFCRASVSSQHEMAFLMFKLSLCSGMIWNILHWFSMEYTVDLDWLLAT